MIHLPSSKISSVAIWTNSLGTSPESSIPPLRVTFRNILIHVGKDGA